MEQRRGLGRGLQALIEPDEPGSAESVTYVSPGEIAPNRFQPRKQFADERLQELMDSIREKGVVQPVIVRRLAAGGYELIAGERRLRAIKALGQERIPVIVKDVSDVESLQLSLIENIQRDDLNPLEEATAFEQLARDFGFTQEQIAKTMGKSRAAVANTLRLLSLPEKIKQALVEGQISFGHAKVLLSMDDYASQLQLLDKIIKENLSVRQAEQWIADKGERAVTTRPQTVKDQHVAELESELQHILGTKVVLSHGKKQGKIVIEYYSLDDLGRILDIIRR